MKKKFVKKKRKKNLMINESSCMQTLTHVLKRVTEETKEEEEDTVVDHTGEVEVVAVMVLTSTIHINKEFSIAINLAILHRTAPFDG